MSNLWVQESWVWVETFEAADGSIDDRGFRAGESEVYETGHGRPGELFRSCQREFGRCTSKVYVGEGKPIGWVFERKAKYTDTGKPYTQQTWVTVHEKPPTKAVTYHYAELR
jgi:hypothetical protein